MVAKAVEPTEPIRWDPVLAELTDALSRLGTPERAEGEQRYLKSDLAFLGVPLPAIRQVATGLRRRYPELAAAERTALVETLWAARIFELRMVAVELLHGWLRRLTPADLVLLERLLRDSHTWALVDPLASRVAGGLAVRTGEDGSATGTVLDRWAGDPDFWIRRSALLALLAGVRAGKPDLDRLDRYAEAMLAEREFFIRKAIGWVLRELSKRDPAWVAAWMAPRTGRASGVTVREAVRHLPAADHDRLLDAYRRRVPAIG